MKTREVTEAVERTVLESIKPTSEESRKMGHAAVSFISKLNAAAKPLRAKAILGGSGAKDTWLKGVHDIDIFVLFNLQKYASRSAELSGILLPYLKKSFPGKKIERLHGSRDYFQLAFQGYTFEVIPILHIQQAEQAKNITDISPLHAVWVNENTKKLKDQVRLAKQFLRAQKLYGAESYIGGLSGYVVEILIAHYGSFRKLLEASLRWKVKEVIDLAGHYAKKDALFELNKSKTQSPLIVIDPVDKGRNAAAALSEEAFMKLKSAAKEYLKKPSASFFEKKALHPAELQEKAKAQHLNLILLEAVPREGKEDIAGMKLRKAFEHIRKRAGPFSVKNAGWEWQGKGKALFYFTTAIKELPKEAVIMGPPLHLKEHVQAFRRKYKKTSVKDNRVMAQVEVKNRQLHEAVTHILKEDYLRGKVKKIKVIIS